MINPKHNTPEYKLRLMLATLGAMAIATSADLIRTMDEDQFRKWLTAICGGDATAAIMAVLIVNGMIEQASGGRDVTP